jgi:hypothetical protein
LVGGLFGVGTGVFAGILILDAGHFVLDEKLDEITALIRAFLAKQDLGPS